jgi:hypothetical protein
MQAAAKAGASPAGTTSPPSPTASAIPPTSVATVARPDMAASMIVSGRPSDLLDRTTRCPRRNASVTGETGPSKVTASPRSSSATRASQRRA